MRNTLSKKNLKQFSRYLNVLINLLRCFYLKNAKQN